jgi:S-formylglutathione hydrolase FrmB
VTGNIERIAHSGKKIIFTCGSSDRFFELNNRFQKKCEEYAINATYVISPGGHENGYWKSTIGSVLDFFSKQIKSVN